MRRALVIVLIGLALVAAYLLGRGQLPGVSPSERPSEPPEEVARSWSRVHDAPSDPNGWAELGDAQSAAGDLVGAEHSYLTAIRMGGDNGLAYARLGFLHYAKNEDDRALALLLEAKRRGAEVPMLDYTIDALRSRDAEPEAMESAEVKKVDDAGVEPLDAASPSPPPPAAPPPPAVPPPPPALAGECSVPAKRLAEGRTYTVTVALHGYWAELIIDTGASITVVTREFAEAVRLPEDPNASIQAITANGRVELATAVVPEIVLANRVAQNVRVAICDRCVESVADGLLGLDLVAAFGMRLDLSKDAIHFSDCE